MEISPLLFAAGVVGSYSTPMEAPRGRFKVCLMMFSFSREDLLGRNLGKRFVAPSSMVDMKSEVFAP